MRASAAFEAGDSSMLGKPFSFLEPARDAEKIVLGRKGWDAFVAETSAASSSAQSTSMRVHT
eukprot:CAMPEP_0181206010 /NCGR_PEP_ID=MMETSP1096-20121128/20793_1 /TAXON_ID=156174 ORGANISM="Chrysochromulina ericina, Strain CCMP281" /NCGR_SAMPLE_ID=MMETSP1096 /ASSEMBLY_ACC=CAM_ASM_000453 /LENGTH=61 /DNA_ID=CAMNT_0023296853 /DNA_START=505 /DNA_END=690 /DNA_ORIENTATION=+